MFPRLRSSDGAITVPFSPELIPCSAMEVPLRGLQQFWGTAH